MDWLVDLFVGPGAAGITGLFGGMVSKFFEAKAKREQYRYEERMRELDIEESKLERDHEVTMADKQMERAQVEGELAIEEGELRAFNTSQKEGNRVEGLLRFVRPGITFYLLVAVSILFGAVWQSVGGLDAFNAQELSVMLHDMVNAAIYLTVMCIGWWFGSRGGNVFKLNK